MRVWRNFRAVTLLRRRLTVLAAFASVALPARVVAQAAPISDDSVRAAVQRFYDWYAPMASRVEGPAWMAALARKQFTFAPELVAALRADSVAAAKSDDDEEGLDGDPFLNAQDACRRYVAKTVRRRGAAYLVDVLGSGGCAKHTVPDVVVEVVAQDGKLVFANFRYPDDDSDLLTELKNLHPEP